MKTSLLSLATAGTGLVAGLFVAFAIAVMPGLRHAGDPVFVSAMQRINVSIVNPLFLLLFLGSPVLLAAAVAVGPERRWSGIALGLTVVALAITFTVNIPLNDKLAAAGTTDPAAARAAFEHTWNLAHDARTLLMLGSFAAALVATTRS